MGPCTEQQPGDGEESLKALFSMNRPSAIEAPATPIVRERLVAIARAGLPKELFAFWKGLAALDTLHIQAEVEIWKSAKGTENRRDFWGAASFELWETGERYRFSAPVPLDLGMSQVAELALDGQRFQMYMRDSSLVTVGSTDSRTYSAPLRSPLALAAFYLTPSDDAKCALCELRLSDLKAVADDVTESALGSQGTLLKTPSARWGSQVAVGYRLDYKPARRGVVSTIERVTARGQVLSRVKLMYFNPVPGHPDLVFPWTIVYEIMDDRGRQPIARHTYRIGLIEADKRIPDSVFQLSTQGGRHVWDDDKRIHMQ
jgi:hypothetical protein